MLYSLQWFLFSGTGPYLSFTKADALCSLPFGTDLNEISFEANASGYKKEQEAQISLSHQDLHKEQSFFLFYFCSCPQIYSLLSKQISIEHLPYTKPHCRVGHLTKTQLVPFLSWPQNKAKGLTSKCKRIIWETNAGSLCPYIHIIQALRRLKQEVGHEFETIWNYIERPVSEININNKDIINSAKGYGWNCWGFYMSTWGGKLGPYLRHLEQSDETTCEQKIHSGKKRAF